MNYYLPHVFVINMDKDIDRMNLISNNLDDLGISYKRFPAVKGDEIKNNDKFSQICLSLCTNGIKGCAMSHITLWKYIIDNNIDYALILEDDAEFTDNFNQLYIKFYETVPKDYDMIQMGCIFGCNLKENNNHIAEVIETVIDKSPVHKDGYNEIKYINATHAYIISNKGARKLYDDLIISTHVDMQISDYMANNNFIVYSPNKDLIVQKALNFSSNLTDKFPNLLLKLLDKINLFKNKHKTVSIGWALSESVIKLPLFDVNGILILVVILSILSQNIHSLKIIMLLWLLTEIIYAKGKGIKYLFLFLIISEYTRIKDFGITQIYRLIE